MNPNERACRRHFSKKLSREEAVEICDCLYQESGCNTVFDPKYASLVDEYLDEVEARRTAGKVKCPICDGTGMAPVIENDVETGEVEECPDCEGTGMVEQESYGYDVEGKPFASRPSEASKIEAEKQAIPKKPRKHQPAPNFQPAYPPETFQSDEEREEEVSNFINDFRMQNERGRPQTFQTFVAKTDCPVCHGSLKRYGSYRRVCDSCGFTQRVARDVEAKHPGFVKTKKQRKHWHQGEGAAEEELGKLETPRDYEYAHGVFNIIEENSKKKHKRGELKKGELLPGRWDEELPSPESEEKKAPKLKKSRFDTGYRPYEMVANDIKLTKDQAYEIKSRIKAYLKEGSCKTAVDFQELLPQDSSQTGVEMELSWEGEHSSGTLVAGPEEYPASGTLAYWSIEADEDGNQNHQINLSPDAAGEVADMIRRMNNPDSSDYPSPNVHDIVEYAKEHGQVLASRKTANRIDSAIIGMGKKIAEADPDKVKHLEESLEDLPLQELSAYQNEKSLAVMEEKITLEEGVRLYNILNHWSTSTLAEKVVTTQIMGELLEMRIKDKDKAAGREDRSYTARPEDVQEAFDNLPSVKCEECGKELGPEQFLSKWNVCGDCIRKKHERVTRGGSKTANWEDFNVSELWVEKAQSADASKPMDGLDEDGAYVLDQEDLDWMNFEVGWDLVQTLDAEAYWPYDALIRSEGRFYLAKVEYGHGRQRTPVQPTQASKTAWTEDMPDVSRGAKMLMDFTNGIHTPEHRPTYDEAKKYIKDKLMSMSEAYVLNEGDMDILEDYNYHLTNAILAELALDGVIPSSMSDEELDNWARSAEYEREIFGSRKTAMMLMTKDILNKIPPLYSQEDNPDPMVWVKFFTPWSNWTWLATEYDPEQRLFFGFVIGDYPELGYFSLDELESVRGPMGITIERDKYWKPCPLSEAKAKEMSDLGVDIKDQEHQEQVWGDDEFTQTTCDECGTLFEIPQRELVKESPNQRFLCPDCQAKEMGGREASHKTAAGKRLMFQEIQDWDMKHNSSYIRELEMTLELGARNNVPLMMQFFRDMKVYGLDEAIVYAKGYEEDGELDEGTAFELGKVRDKIKKRMKIASRKTADGQYTSQDGMMDGGKGMSDVYQRPSPWDKIDEVKKCDGCGSVYKAEPFEYNDWDTKCRACASTGKTFELTGSFEEYVPNHDPFSATAGTALATTLESLNPGLEVYEAWLCESGDHFTAYLRERE